MVLCVTYASNLIVYFPLNRLFFSSIKNKVVQLLAIQIGFSNCQVIFKPLLTYSLKKNLNLEIPFLLLLGSWTSQFYFSSARITGADEKWPRAHNVSNSWVPFLKWIPQSSNSLPSTFSLRLTLNISFDPLRCLCVILLLQICWIFLLLDLANVLC